MTLGKDRIDVTATLERVEQTLREDASLSPSVRSLLELLVVIIQLLIAKLGLNSTNSSIPPSQDPHRARRAKRQAARRKPGGQNGHPGSTLNPLPPDRIEPLEIDRRTLPKGADYRSAGFEARQVIDIEIARHVTEYRAEILLDAEGHRFVAEFPPGITRPVQYGNTVKAQAVYLSQQQLIPYERIRDYFTDQCGIPLSSGSLVNFNRDAFERLETFEAIVKQHLLNEPLLNADETGVNVNGQRLWLHCLSSPAWTLFCPHLNRGEQAMIDMGVLPHFQGILCHDHWKPYFRFDCAHVLCNAHHLRELQRAFEHDDQQWAKKMHSLLLEINTATIDAGGVLSIKAASAFRQRYRRLLDRADRECPPPQPKRDGARGRPARSKSRNLLERLRNFETETLRFMTDPCVPFTNNLGENDLRMTKVQQKISGCFRSFEGAQFFCRIRSYLSSCRKHNLKPTEALNILFSGRLPDFIPPLE